MPKNQSLLFRFLLFFAGAGIVLLAFFLFRGAREELEEKHIFMWVSIGIMYLVFFLPFFFSVIKVGNFSEKIPSLSMIWSGIVFYVIASTVVIILLLTVPQLTVRMSIVIQSILLFLFSIVIYFSYFASSKIASVAAEESGKQRYTNELKPKAQSLLLSVNQLPAEYEKAQNTLKQALEDIRYIYPVNGNAGSDLELRIMQSLNIVSELCGDISDGANTASLEKQAEKLLMLVKERKLLRN